MRVIAGALRGRIIHVPEGDATRPTSDRVRESVFARLGDVSGCAVLDLFAGSGALGIEALSRGASRVVSVECARRAARTIERNVDELGLAGKLHVMRAKVPAALDRLAERGERFDLVFLDPPYEEGAIERTLTALLEADLLEVHAVVVAEGAKRHSFEPVPGLECDDERRYGDTVVRIFVRGRSAQGHDGPERSANAPGDGMPDVSGEQRQDSSSEDVDRDREGKDRSMTGAERQTRVALFPASFDPLTNGHLDLVHRSLAIFDEIVIGLAKNISKSGTFSTKERLEMLEGVFCDEPRVRIDVFDGLVVDHARAIGASAIIRGLRAVSDFEYEFEMALMNKHLNPEVEILFLASSQQYLYVSSSRLKELVRFGASVDEFVPPIVADHLKRKLG